MSTPGEAKVDAGRFMAEAIRLAERGARAGEVPVGAVIVLDDRILASAHNEVELRGDGTAHAEVLALRRAVALLGDRRLSEATMFVTLEPCAMCAGACVLARLGKLVYGAVDPKAGAVESVFQLLEEPRLNHRVDVIGGFEGESCGERLSDFFKTLRRAKRSSKMRDKSGPS